MQHTAMHVQLSLFRDGAACLLVPAGMGKLKDIRVSIWHGDTMVLEKTLQVQHFNSGKAYLSIPCTEDIIWQHGEWVIMGVTGSESIEIVRSVKNYAQVAIGPGDLDLAD